jgi:hypothetical protein
MHHSGESTLTIDPRYAVLFDPLEPVVYLLDELRPVVLFGEPGVRVLALIDGRRTLPQVAEQTSPCLGPEVTETVVAQLIEDGIVHLATPG